MTERDLRAAAVITQGDVCEHTSVHVVCMQGVHSSTYPTGALIHPLLSHTHRQGIVRQTRDGTAADIHTPAMTANKANRHLVS